MSVNSMERLHFAKLFQKICGRGSVAKGKKTAPNHKILAPSETLISCLSPSLIRWPPMYSNRLGTSALVTSQKFFRQRKICRGNASTARASVSTTGQHPDAPGSQIAGWEVRFGETFSPSIPCPICSLSGYFGSYVQGEEHLWWWEQSQGASSIEV